MTMEYVILWLLSIFSVIPFFQHDERILHYNIDCRIEKDSKCWWTFEIHMGETTDGQICDRIWCSIVGIWYYSIDAGTLPIGDWQR
jgi:hypothetical protein